MPLSALGVFTVRDLCAARHEHNSRAQTTNFWSWSTSQAYPGQTSGKRDVQYIRQQWGRIPYVSQEKGVVDVSLDENFIPQKLSPEFGCKV